MKKSSVLSYAVPLACVAFVMMSGDASAFDDKKEGGKILVHINDMLGSSITPLVLGIGSVVSFGYAAIQQTLTPLLYGGGALLFYKGAKAFVDGVATALI